MQSSGLFLRKWVPLIPSVERNAEDQLASRTEIHRGGEHRPGLRGRGDGPAVADRPTAIPMSLRNGWCDRTCRGKRTDGANSRYFTVQLVQRSVQLVDQTVRGLIVDISGMSPHVSPGSFSRPVSREVTHRSHGREITRIKTGTQLVHLSLCLADLTTDDIDGPIESDRIDDVADRGLELRGVVQQMLVTGRSGEVIPDLRPNVPGQGHQLAGSIIDRAATKIISKREIRSHQESHRKRCAEECRAHDLSRISEVSGCPCRGQTPRILMAE